jgi:predicted amidohydrolase
MIIRTISEDSHVRSRSEQRPGHRSRAKHRRKIDIAFADGCVAAIGRNLGPARETRDVAGKIVAPGLIDMHTYVYWGGASLAVAKAQSDLVVRIKVRVGRGTFRPGSLGDAMVLEIAEGAIPFTDAVGQTVIGRQKFVCHGAVLGGRWWQ